MTTDVDTPPTIKEELNRKTLESLSEMANSHDKGMMSDEAFYQSLTAINLVTCGLIDDDVTDWISEHASQNGEPVVMRRVFRTKGMLVIMKRVMTEDSFVMTKISDGGEPKDSVKSFEDADDPTKTSHVAYLKLISQLLERGFVEV
ncbi:hypothetical protein VCR15J2_390072 [Vibrio coralliirubri]|uniref:hypothetical protein n=1 Tax=Vibrio coralliirubri TaxID=1516159 RepID=UPI00062EEA8F|nr:hypothetical protein [Vibrio coralliirubri]CDT53442.1 hypothetical protein VCR15J2_390072 [Vibrio coralliirubri]